jgi:hypothetical protein
MTYTDVLIGYTVRPQRDVLDLRVGRQIKLDQ